MNRFCSACNIEKDTNKYKKDRTVCKNCYKRNENKQENKDNNTLIPNQQPKIEKTNRDNNPNYSTFEKHAYVVIGPRNVGKTSYMLKLLEKRLTKDQSL